MRFMNRCLPQCASLTRLLICSSYLTLCFPQDKLCTPHACLCIIPVELRSPTKNNMGHFLNATFFHRFSAANYDSALSLFSARQVSEKAFPGISYFSHLRQTRCARNIPKPVLDTKLITKETTYTLDFRKYFVVSFWSHSIRAFSVLLEDLLKIISET
jgi:hypothetical protein